MDRLSQIRKIWRLTLTVSFKQFGWYLNFKHMVEETQIIWSEKDKIMK